MPGTSSSGGRNRKSQAEHALAGTGRKDRGTARPPAEAQPLLDGGFVTNPPDPPAGRPPIPIGLIGPALEEWKRMVVRLEAAQTVSTVDDAALYQYCCLFAETEHVIEVRKGNAALIVTLQTAIDKWTRMVDRLDVDDDTGAAAKIGAQIVEGIAHIVDLKKLDMKLTTQLRQGHMAIRQYLVELGMTPAARSRVKVPDGPAAADPFAEFDGKAH